MFALDDYSLAAPDELEVDATVGLASAALRYRIALAPVNLTNKEFEIRPAHLPERLQASGAGDERALPPSLANAIQAGG
jgi:hypothetical protein